MSFIRKYKWVIHWSFLALIIVSFICSAIFLEHKVWIANLLQALGTLAGIYLTLIIFLLSKEDSDKQFKEHLDHLQELNHRQIITLQELNNRHIDVLQNTTEKQIKVWQDLVSKQIETLQNGTEQQIKALQELTEKQIDALHKTTYNEISAFEQQNREITNKLTDNSILLAELLGRELEKSINDYDVAIRSEERKYKDLSGWKLLRTPQEKEQQLRNQWNKIEQIKRGYEYLVNKYQQVRSFLGFGQKGLNG